MVRGVKNNEVDYNYHFKSAAAFVFILNQLPSSEVERIKFRESTDGFPVGWDKVRGPLAKSLNDEFQSARVEGSNKADQT